MHYTINMTSFRTDSLATMKFLNAAGISKKQAEAISQAIHDVNKGVVTREYLDSRLNDFEFRFEQKIDQKLVILEQRMTIKMGLMLAATIGVLAKLQGLF